MKQFAHKYAVSLGVLRFWCLALACMCPLAYAQAGSGSAPPGRIVLGLAEPLFSTGDASPSDKQGLDRALTRFQSKPNPGAEVPEIFEPLETFLRDHPDSGWRSAVQTNLGLAYYRAGYMTRAMHAFEDAWERGRHDNRSGPKEMVDRAVGELAVLLARFGYEHELSRLLATIGSRPLSGPATELLTEAREASWLFRNEPETSFLCGPVALRNLLLSLHADDSVVQRLDGVRSGPEGFTFAEVSKLALSLGLDHKMIKRALTDPIPVPSIVNWRLNHYAAIVEQIDGRYHVKDSTFPTGEAWLSASAVNEEASGYFLVPASGHADKWQVATLEETMSVHGRGKTVRNDDSATKDEDQTIHPVCATQGMCVANAKEMLVSLHLSDIPVGYQPPVGPAVMVKLVYNQRESSRRDAANEMFFSVGKKWTMNFQSWIEDDPNAAGPTASLVRFPPSGGYVDYAGYTYTQGAESGQYSIDPAGGTLRRWPAKGPATRYEYESPSGEKFEYSVSDGALRGTRRLFLHKITDQHNKALTLEYELSSTEPGSTPSVRLTAILDATERRTTFEYLPGKLTISKIVDPFGRTATLEHTRGFLKSITDVMNMTSSFGYSVYEAADLPQAPFDLFDSRGHLVIGQTSDPKRPSSVGVESRGPKPGPTYKDYGLIQTMTTPYGTSVFTFGQNDYENYRYLTIQDTEKNVERVEFRHQAPGVPASEAEVPQGIGSLDNANKNLDYRNSFYWDKNATVLALNGNYYDFRMARITHWLHTIDNRTASIMESRKQPLESRVWFLYPGQTHGSYFVGTTSSPTVVARVLSDHSTQKFALQYDNSGQLWKYTDPRGRVTELTRDTNGIDIVSIGRRASEFAGLVELRGFKYDESRRIKQLRLATGNHYDYVYDDANHTTTRTDRAGRVDVYRYNELEQLRRVEIEGTAIWKGFEYDAQGRLGKQSWSNGYQLVYGYDDLDRLTSITYPDNSVQSYVYDILDLKNVVQRNGITTAYSWDRTRRLQRYFDGMTVTVIERNENRPARNQKLPLKCVTVNGDQKTCWDYDLQGRPTVKIYADGSKESYIYDKSVPLLAEYVDSAGYHTKYTYGADGRIQILKSRGAVDDLTVIKYDDPYYFRPTSVRKGPATGDGGDEIAFDFYPPLSPNGDPILGAHQLKRELSNGIPRGPLYTYDSVGRLSTSTLGTTVNYEYDSLSRLKTYHALRDFGFTYYPDSGRIKSIDSDLVGTAFTYKEAVADLRLSTLVNHPGTAYKYSYDISGNIKHIDESHKGDSVTGQWAYDYDELGRITQGAKLPNVSTFRHDDSGNLTTLRGQSFSYNSLNQLASQPVSTVPLDQQRRYVYDGSNRLVEIIYKGNPAKHTLISYDPLGRVKRITDHTRQGFEYVTDLTWCGVSVCQEMSGFGVFWGKNLSARNFLWEGHHDSSGGNTFYLRDHLGSVRETVSDSGVTLASYDYDPYGKSLTGATPTIGFAGMYFHVPSGLYFARNRVYDPGLGRWLTRDPIGERGGLNIYAYADNNPLNRVDRVGLDVDIIVNNNTAITGAHVGLYVSTTGRPDDNLLFDPGGAYHPVGQGRGSADFFESDDANLRRYIRYQKSDGPSVQIFHFDLTPAQDDILRQAINEFNGCWPLFCVVCSSSVLSNLDLFADVGIILTPAGLAWELENLKKGKGSPIPYCPPIIGRGCDL